MNRAGAPAALAAALRASALLVLLLATTGCALLQRDREGADAEPPPPPPVVQLQVQAPKPLDELLRSNLDLSRLRSAEPVTETELQRLVAAAPAQARSLLETEGYFDATVTVAREPGDPPVVRLGVTPGPRTRVERLTFEVQSDLERAAAGGDAQALALIERLRRGWPLNPGEPFRNPVWSAAKNTTLGQLRSAGYAAATWSGTGAQVDARTHLARLFLVADSGPLFRTGELVIEGLDKQDEVTVRNLAGFGPGAPASETLLLDYQERLQSSGLFDRATVSFEPDPDKAAAVPVLVSLHEQKLQQATVGVGISADTGPRVTLDHFHRRPFGQRATARNKVEVARLRQAWEGEFSSQALPRFYRNLVGGSVERLESDTDTVTSVRARVGRTKESPRIERLAFAEVERATVRTATTRTQADAVSINYHGIWRDVDSVLLPTNGQAIALQGGLGRASSSAAPPGPFVRTYARYQLWRPLGSWYGQARIELGRVFVSDQVQVPDPQLFRAGGDDSVRGYGYRSLGSVNVDGSVRSGRVLFTTSLEIARPLTPRLPALWWAAFVDAGDAADRTGDLRPAVGVGLGLRYRSPIGPLRVDGAWGERNGKFRLHLSVGVAL
jgi:translocation and assembly module TamA